MKRFLSYLENPDIINILLVVAVLFRLVLIPNPGFEADVSFWKSWGLAVRDFGIVKGLPLTNFNYPTPFAYFLGLMANVYSFFADPHNYNEFWNNANLLFLAISKTPAILADFGIFAVIVWIGKNAKRINFPQLPMTMFYALAFFYLLNPLSFFDGALWGQVDSVGVLLFLLANCLVFTKKPLLAGIVYMISMMTKLQNMIYGPVFFLFIWQYLGYEGLMQSIGGALGTFFVLNIEFISAKQFSRVVGDLTGNYDYFPWLSLNAYNVWWIVARARGMQSSDKMAAIGIVNAKTVGLYMFASTYLLACFTMLKSRVRGVIPDLIGDRSWSLTKTKTDSRLRGNDMNVDTIVSKELILRYLTGLIIAAAGFFLFQTESHDRYAFPISVFILLWAPFWITLESRIDKTDVVKKFKSFAICYLLFTLLYFYNVHNAFIANYPNNGIPFLTILNVPTLTILASFLQIGFFGYFLYIIRRLVTAPLFLLCVGTCVFLIFAKNSALILKKPVAITSLTPITSTAGYGQPQLNMPVDATFDGFTKWGFLSVQYAYYKHGIGTHAPSHLTYDINRQFKKLSTDMGIDTDAGPQGSVQFEVYGDRKLLYASDIVRRYEFPRHADVNVTGVKKLELIVTDGGNGITDDHADWLNTYLIP